MSNNEVVVITNDEGEFDIPVDIANEIELLVSLNSNQPLQGK